MGCLILDRRPTQPPPIHQSIESLHSLYMIPVFLSLSRILYCGNQFSRGVGARIFSGPYLRGDLLSQYLGFSKAARSVKGNIHPGLKAYTKNRAIADVSGSTVGECLDDLGRQFPGIEKGMFDKDGKLQPHFDIYVDPESFMPEGMSKRVEDGGELYIILIVTGG